MDSIIKAGDYTTLRIDATSVGFENVARDVREDKYAKYFHGHFHYNFIALDQNGEPIIISVLSESNEHNIHKGLVTDKKGYNEIQVYSGQRNTDETAEQSLTLVEHLEEALKKMLEVKELYFVYNTSKFAAEFLKFEEKHPQKRTAMKLGLIYCKSTQNEPKQMFLNSPTECSESYWNFIKTVAKEIDLSQWNGYRGDMSDVGTTYHQSWHQIDIIYHVAPLLDSEGHRRLIGNDIAVIFFLEESAQKFDPTFLDQLGTVPQIFGVVQPQGDKFRVGFLCRSNIKNYGPAPPKELLDINQLSEILLTKMHNGLVMANYCAPMNRLFYVPRLETLRSIVEKFPMETKKEREKRAREKKKKPQANPGSSAPVFSPEMNIAFDNDATQYSMVNSLVLLVAANLAYLDPTLAISEIPKQIGISNENVKIFGDISTETQGYIAHDDEKVLIALAGTRSLRFTRKPFDKKNKAPFTLPQTTISLHGCVRHIFVNGIYAVWDEISGYLENHCNIEQKKKKIWVCGYCTGGGLATLLTHVLLQPQLKFRNYLAGLYTYGAPAIGDEMWGKTYDLLFKHRTNRVVNNGDVIPYITPKPGKLHQVGVLYYVTPDGQIEREYKPKNPTAGSLDSHLVESYFQALIPHHKSVIETRGHTRDRIYSTVHQPHWMMEAQAAEGGGETRTEAEPEGDHALEDVEDDESTIVIGDVGNSPISMLADFQELAKKANEFDDLEIRLHAKKGEKRAPGGVFHKAKSRPVQSVRSLWDNEEEDSKSKLNTNSSKLNLSGPIPILPQGNSGNSGITGSPGGTGNSWKKPASSDDNAGGLRIGSRAAETSPRGNKSSDESLFPNSEEIAIRYDSDNDDSSGGNNVNERGESSRKSEHELSDEDVFFSRKFKNADGSKNSNTNDGDVTRRDSGEIPEVTHVQRPRANPFTASDPVKLQRVNEEKVKENPPGWNTAAGNGNVNSGIIGTRRIATPGGFVLPSNPSFSSLTPTSPVPLSRTTTAVPGSPPTAILAATRSAITLSPPKSLQKTLTSSNIITSTAPTSAPPATPPPAIPATPAVMPENPTTSAAPSTAPAASTTTPATPATAVTTMPAPSAPPTIPPPAIPTGIPATPAPTSAPPATPAIPTIPASVPPIAAATPAAIPATTPQTTAIPAAIPVTTSQTTVMPAAIPVATPQTAIPAAIPATTPAAATPQVTTIPAAIPATTPAAATPQITTISAAIPATIPAATPVTTTAATTPAAATTPLIPAPTATPQIVSSSASSTDPLMSIPTIAPPDTASKLSSVLPTKLSPDLKNSQSGVIVIKRPARQSPYGGTSLSQSHPGNMTTSPLLLQANISSQSQVPALRPLPALPVIPQSQPLSPQPQSPQKQRQPTYLQTPPQSPIQPPQSPMQSPQQQEVHQSIEQNKSQSQQDAEQHSTISQESQLEDMEFVINRLRGCFSPLLSRIKQIFDMDIAGNSKEFRAVYDVYVGPLIQKLQIIARVTKKLAGKSSQGIFLGEYLYDGQLLETLEAKVWSLLMGVGQFLKVAKNISETGFDAPESLKRSMILTVTQVRELMKLCEEVLQKRVKNSEISTE